MKGDQGERYLIAREEIREAMLAHERAAPLCKPISAKSLAAQLPHLDLAESSIAWHIKAIRTEAEAEAARVLGLEII